MEISPWIFAIPCTKSCFDEKERRKSKETWNHSLSRFCLLFLRLSLTEMKGKSSSYDQSYWLLNSIGEFIRFISKCVHKRRVVAVCLRLITKFVNPTHDVHLTVFEQITACFWIRWGRTTKDTDSIPSGTFQKCFAIAKRDTLFQNMIDCTSDTLLWKKRNRKSRIINENR